MFANAVADGVFNERLQKKRRHELIEGCGIRMQGEGEAIAEALLLNTNIEIEELELAGERNFIFPI